MGLYAQAVVEDASDVSVRTALEWPYAIHIPGLFVMLSADAAEAILDQLTALMFAAESDARDAAALALLPPETPEQDR